MKRSLLSFLLLGLSAMGFTQPKKILIVSTNVDTLEGSTNGTFLMEIAFPIAAFKKAGVEVIFSHRKAAKQQSIIAVRFRKNFYPLREVTISLIKQLIRLLRIRSELKGMRESSIPVVAGNFMTWYKTTALLKSLR